MGTEIAFGFGGGVVAADSWKSRPPRLNAAEPIPSENRVPEPPPIASGLPIESPPPIAPPPPLAVPVESLAARIRAAIYPAIEPDSPPNHPPPATSTGLRPIPLDSSSRPLVAEYEESPEGVAPRVLEAAPAWLVSLILHVTLMIAFALMMIVPHRDSLIDLQLGFSDEAGTDGPLESEIDLGLDQELDWESEALTPDPLPEAMPSIDSPLSTTEQTVIPGTGPTALTAPLSAPSIQMALSGRTAGMKNALLAAYGGNASTEAAVTSALRWLARNQERSGSWSLQGPYRNGCNQENRIAATAMALLAFQGAGHTHQDGSYRRRVQRGIQYLLRQQDGYGDFFRTNAGPRSHRLYSQAQATMVVCEAYAMTGDSKLREPAQRAIGYAVANQASEGGWRYVPGRDSDTSVTGWFAMALQSARMANLHVPDETLERLSQYLDLARDTGGYRYGYRPRFPSSVTMTAESLLCRQYLGWRQDDPRLIDGAGYLLENPIRWRQPNVYYWYYATQVLHHMEGDAWDQWNKVLRQMLPDNQVSAGREEGSWAPGRDRWAVEAGRLYMTCLCTYMLEVYYRHLPIYSELPGAVP